MKPGVSPGLNAVPRREVVRWEIDLDEVARQYTELAETCPNIYKTLAERWDVKVTYVQTLILRARRSGALR